MKAHLGHLATIWDYLQLFKPFGTIWDPFKSMSDHIGLFQTILAYLEPFLNILNDLCLF